MAVTDWTQDGRIDSNMSARLGTARFTVLIDKDFALEDNGLPIERAERQIERVTENISVRNCLEISAARLDPSLPTEVIQHYLNGGYVHLYIEP